MKKALVLGFILMGCASSEYQNKEDQEGKVPVYICDNTTYYYIVSSLDEKNIYLVLDDRVHAKGNLTFPKESCKRSLAPSIPPKLRMYR